jgi:bifunctional DNA-binding transcriptional regulator/antitoxin component of YhaV-PrlF toxin-antitoxin module
MPESLAQPLGTIRVGEHGEITVPASYRKKHKLAKGSEVLLLQLGATLMVVPVDPALDRLCQRLQKNLEGAGVTLEKALKNLPRVRRQLFQELYGKK